MSVRLAHSLIALVWLVATAQRQTGRPVPIYYYPMSVAVDSHGAVYVSGKNNKIIKLSPDGAASDFAGSPNGATAHRDGAGTLARFEDLKEIAIDAADNVYVTDLNKVRKVTPAGVVSTLAGSERSVLADGVGATASFKSPSYITASPDGRVYVVDRTATNLALIRVITPQGVVTTMQKPDGGALEIEAYGVAVDPAGNLLVSDVGRCVKRIAPDGKVTVLAGLCGTRATSPIYKEGDVATAELMQPGHLAVSSNGAIYLSDLRLNRIISIADGRVSTVAGNSKIDHTGANIQGYSEGGYLDGPAKTALFNSPEGIAFDRAGNLFIVDTTNQCIRKLSPIGTVTTFSK